MPNFSSISAPGPDLHHLFKMVPQVPYSEKVNTQMEQFRLFAIAILAAMLEPEKIRSRNPAPAIKRAAGLLDRLPEYLPFQNLSKEQERARLRRQIDADRQVMRFWLMDKGEKFTFEQFIRTPGCQHKSVRELKAMLKRLGFPFLETPKESSDFPSFWPAGQITSEAYQQALKIIAEERRERKLESQKIRRTKKKRLASL
jgi:hypothetical protein